MSAPCRIDRAKVLKTYWSPIQQGPCAAKSIAELLSRPKALPPRSAVLRMCHLIVRTGSAHSIQAPIDRRRRIAFFPEGGATNEGAKRSLGSQASAYAGSLILNDVERAHAAAPSAFMPAARRIVRRMMVWKIRIL